MMEKETPEDEGKMEMQTSGKAAVFMSKIKVFSNSLHSAERFEEYTAAVFDIPNSADSVFRIGRIETGAELERI